MAVAVENFLVAYSAKYRLGDYIKAHMVSYIIQVWPRLILRARLFAD